MRQQEHKRDLEDKLDHFRTRVADLERRADMAETQSGIPSYRHLDELRRQERTLRRKLHELGDATDDAWEKVRAGADEAWARLERAFDCVRDMFDAAADRIREKK